jgi:predicted protein tyrosine phosphatase
MRLINGYQVSQAIHVAAVLGIADHLREAPRSSDELAALTDTHPQSLYRLLRALAAVGVFHEDGERRFSLTKMGQSLRSDTADSIAGWASLIGRPYYWQTWGHFLHSVRTGDNAFRDLHGSDVWAYRSDHPEESAIFDRAMTALSRGTGAAVIAAYDFGPFDCIVDVGGGQGQLLADLLAARRSARGILLDLPHVVSRAEALLRGKGVAERCQIVGGSFFENVPAGGDLYMLKAILHDWKDEEAIRILRVCRRATKPEGRLLVIERVLGPPNEAADGKFSDLNMLVAPGGQERTREEFASLLAAAGFTLTRVIPTGTRHSLIEGAPA